MTSAANGAGMLSLSLRPLNEDTQQLACRWRGCSETNRLFCPQSLYDHLCQAHASTSYAALVQTHDANGDGEGKNEMSEGVACLWEGCQYRCKSKKRHHMNSHLRSHVPLSPFQCHICSVTFKWKSDLTKHLRRQHNISPTTAGTPDEHMADVGSNLAEDTDGTTIPGIVMEHSGLEPVFLQPQMTQLQGNLLSNGFVTDPTMASVQTQQLKQGESAAALQQWINAIREGQMPVNSDDPMMQAMWNEKSAGLDAETLKQLLSNNIDATQLVDNSFGGSNVNQQMQMACVKSEPPTSPPAMPTVAGMTDTLQLLGQRGVSPAITDDMSVASPPPTDAFLNGLPLASFTTPAHPYMLDQQAALLANNLSLSQPAMSASLSPQIVFAPQMSPQPAVTLSPPASEASLYGTSLESTGFPYSPPAKIEEEPVQMDPNQYSWLLQQDYPMGIQSAMGVQPNDLFNMSSQGSPPSALTTTDDAQTNMVNWANSLGQINGMTGISNEERKLRRVHSTPMLVDRSRGARSNVRTPGSPSMLRPMPSGEFRARMISQSRSTDRLGRQHASAAASLLRSSQSVDALRMQATAAAAAAAAAAAVNTNAPIPENSTLGLNVHPAFSMAGAMGNIVPTSATSGIVPSAGAATGVATMDKRTRAQVDGTLLRRMRQVSLSGSSGAPGQIKFKRSLDRIRWQGQ
jgi:hypothetical protein